MGRLEYFKKLFPILVKYGPLENKDDIKKISHISSGGSPRKIFSHKNDEKTSNSDFHSIKLNIQKRNSINDLVEKEQQQHINTNIRYEVKNKSSLLAKDKCGEKTPLLKQNSTLSDKEKVSNIQKPKTNEKWWKRTKSAYIISGIGLAIGVIGVGIFASGLILGFAFPPVWAVAGVGLILGLALGGYCVGAVGLMVVLIGVDLISDEEKAKAPKNSESENNQIKDKDLEKNTEEKKEPPHEDLPPSYEGLIFQNPATGEMKPTMDEINTRNGCIKNELIQVTK